MGSPRVPIRPKATRWAIADRFSTPRRAPNYAFSNLVRAPAHLARKWLSALPGREAQIELRCSAGLSSPENPAPRPTPWPQTNRGQSSPPSFSPNTLSLSPLHRHLPSQTTVTSSSRRPPRRARTSTRTTPPPRRAPTAPRRAPPPPRRAQRHPAAEDAVDRRAPGSVEDGDTPPHIAAPPTRPRRCPSPQPRRCPSPQRTPSTTRGAAEDLDVLEKARRRLLSPAAAPESEEDIPGA